MCCRLENSCWVCWTPIDSSKPKPPEDVEEKFSPITEEDEEITPIHEDSSFEISSKSNEEVNKVGAKKIKGLKK